ncbi:hypothetical protein [Actinophytocola sp.]|uniref:hypothetical protein n=1 Tax=Actinophytocola sp. TaxID=1872138 RepID=UPI0025C66C36|nr:hypothetical protein [Actinophytocola sp.]
MVPLLVREWGAVEVIALSLGAVTEARRTKPEIPASGDYDIPIRDEIELEMEISQ